MSEEGLELIRRSTDAYSRADFDAFLETWSTDGVLDWSNSHGFEAGIYRGHAEMRSFLERFHGTFEEVRLELIGDPVEVRDGVWVAENVAHMRGRDGIKLQARSAFLITLRDGQQTSLTLYQTREEALEAAGSPESPAPSA